MRLQRIVDVTVHPVSPYYGREALACGHVGLLRPVRTIRRAIAAQHTRQCRRCPIYAFDAGKYPPCEYVGGIDPAEALADIPGEATP